MAFTNPLFKEYRPAWETDDHAEFRGVAREYIAKQVTPNAARWQEQHHIDREAWLGLGEVGLLLPSVPEEYGGIGGDFGHETIVQEELIYGQDSSVGYSVHSTIVPHYILNYGSEVQKQRWLPGLASGEIVGAIAMTEPGAGSDLQAVATTAVRDGDEYVINGAKTFITNGHLCDLVIVVAKTDPAQGAKGISLIVVEDGTEGFEHGRILNKLGLPGQDTSELSFTNVRVPVDNLIGGEEGQGFFQLMGQLGQERLIIGVSAVAACEVMVRQTIDYCHEREAFGRPLLKFQNTRFELADCKTDTFVGRALIDHTITAHIKEPLTAETASMVKLWTTDKQGEVADRCLQLFGGYGYMMEYPIAQAYAAARVQRIYGGTNEIMKEIISRFL